MSNALYVLRLLWRTPPPPSPRTISSIALPLAAATTPSVPPPPPPPFLEDESTEYATAARTLADLPPPAPAPIPWPTLFPRHTPPPPSPKFCDPLYRLVVQAQYGAALAIHAELCAHKVYIQRRHEYLAPAIAALDAGHAEQFFLWLGLYPNKPATANTPELSRIWDPVVARVVAVFQSAGDTAFLERFLGTASKLGVLPTVLPPLSPHLTFTLSPALSHSLLSTSIAAYTRYTTSAESTSKRAHVQRRMVRRQVAVIWAAYLRGLVAAGWREQARELFENPPGVEWDAFTRGYVESRLQGFTPTATPPRDSPLSKQVLSTCLSPSQLASILDSLSSQPLCTTHPTLLPRFKHRFLRQRLGAASGPGTRERERTWLHAEIINLQKQGRHEDAVQLFVEHFFWLGLPPHPSLPSAFAATSESKQKQTQKHYPSIQILVTLLPSLLPLLPPPLSSSAPKYLNAYVQLALDSAPNSTLHSNSSSDSNSRGTTAPPALRPNNVMWSVVVREIVHWGGNKGLEHGRNVLSAAQTAAVDDSDSSGPGEAAYRALLLALAGRRRVHEMYELLDYMEVSDSVGTSTKTGFWKGVWGGLGRVGYRVSFSSSFYIISILGL
ncbi:hypothetical protein I308_104016 [Cryptococcus tetragattii IND107]|uniref:Uncharacterized protein n=1 Tax=Cryptococcus tetragattii IND107 TaxID=1296105 RepID=A0ABR3BRQ0_9TREE